MLKKYSILFICAAMLFIGMAELPMFYYTILRIVVTLGALMTVIIDLYGLENVHGYWIIPFVIIGVLFNPIKPFYFHDKDIWISIDFISGIVFLSRAYVGNKNTKYDNNP